jgi:outer membrane murein-binding lipoprotein Lpp
VLKKIGMLCIAFLLCLTTLTSCASRLPAVDSRVSRLEFELNRAASRIDTLESKLDMLNWLVPPPVVSRTEFETDPRREELEKLVVDLTAQVSRLKEQLTKH